MKLSIGAKLGLGFLIMLLLVVVAGLASILIINQLTILTNRMVQEGGRVMDIGVIWENLARADVALKRAVTSGTDGDIATARYRNSQLQEAITDYASRSQQNQTEDEPSQKQQISTLKGANTEYTTLYDMYLNLVDIRQFHDLLTFSNNINNTLSTYLSALSDMNKIPADRMAEALTGIQRAKSSLNLIMIIITIIAVLLGVGLAIGITRSITVPVRRIVDVADNISMGNMDESLQVTSKDEIGELQESVERMRTSLKTAIDMLKTKRV